MLLNLRKIIEVPGEVPFSFEIDTSDYHFESIKAFLTPLKVTGRVVNSADVLTLNADLETTALCVCDRCITEYEYAKKMKISAILTSELEDEENPDMFLLDGDSANLTEIISTIFILEMDAKFLCREDCKGVCMKCGKNLNDGPCDCKAEIDPRLAVLEQLLKD